MNTENQDCCCNKTEPVKKPIDWTRILPYVVCGIVLFFIIVAVMNSRTQVKPPSPIQSTQITLFNVGACQYVLIGQDKALAVVHKGDCTNHLWQDFTELR